MKVAHEGFCVGRMGKDKKNLKSLKLEETMQEGVGVVDTSNQGNPDGTSRLPVKGAVRRG